MTSASSFSMVNLASSGLEHSSRHCSFSVPTLNSFIEKNRTNLRVAAISAFASQQLSRADPHPFCRTPLNFIRVYKCLEGLDNTEGLLLSLVDEVKKREAVWEPPSKTTKKGFQTVANLFDRPNGRLADLDQMIKNYIEKYRLEFSSRD